MNPVDFHRVPFVGFFGVHHPEKCRPAGKITGGLWKTITKSFSCKNNSFIYTTKSFIYTAKSFSYSFPARGRKFFVCNCCFVCLPAGFDIPYYIKVYLAFVGNKRAQPAFLLKRFPEKRCSGTTESSR